MSVKPLISHDPHDWIAVLSKVLGAALYDHCHKLGRQDGLSLIHYADNSRIRHRRLLTTVYNQFRNELETELST